MPRRWATGLAAVLLLPMAGCSLFHHDDGSKISSSGGSTATKDGSVRVSFGPGQLTGDTKVTIVQNGDGPAPVAGYVPLDRPFDISLDHQAQGGTVSAVYQPPAGINVDAARVSMFIEEDGQWVLVPSTVDAATRTVSGRWPHFSRGHLAFFDPLLDAGDAAADWSWDKVKAGTGWIVDRSGDVANGIAAAAVGLTGGTTDTVRCPTTAKEWVVTNSTGMTGCVAVRGSDSMWPAKVNVRYPYPLVVSLPDAAVGPGVFDLLDTHDPIELALAMVMSRSGKLAVPAGASVPLKLAGNAPRSLRLNAKLDSSVMAVKAVGLLALAVTRGRSGAEISAMRAELNAVEKDLWDAFIAERENHSSGYTLAEYLRDTQADNGLLQQRKKMISRAENAGAVEDFFDKVELISCGTSLVLGAKDASLSFTKQVGKLIDAIFDKCFGVFVKASVTHGYKAQMALLNPAEQAKQIGDLTTGLLEQAKDLRSSVAVGVSGIIDTLSLGKANTATARVTLNRPVPPSRLRNVDWVAAAGARLRCGEVGAEQYFATMYHDITGDEVPDSFVLLNCYVSAGRTSDYLFVFDGASNPAAPRLLGQRPPDMVGRHFTGGCLQFDGKVVTMLSRDYGPVAPSGTPTFGVKVLAMWTGTRLDFSTPVQFPSPREQDVKGCTTTVQPR
ncbi:hypothetical protein ACFY36_11680 [Actinoplanes sp. NPDC000266]